MTKTWHGAAILLASPVLILFACPSSSAEPGSGPNTAAAVPLTARANPGVTQAFAGGPMPPIGEVPNQAHTARSTYRLLPVTLPGPDSSNQAARVRDGAYAQLDTPG
jgi:hypothetical protein